ncbi:hypothetical protein [Streptomyces sp. KL116D]|uniref:hypothetical protein n=1 Tax=Streptomyces sp. KL116D TaxID=3045152 RepID=UPI003558C392
MPRSSTAGPRAPAARIAVPRRATADRLRVMATRLTGEGYGESLHGMLGASDD